MYSYECTTTIQLLLLVFGWLVSEIDLQSAMQWVSIKYGLRSGKAAMKAFGMFVFEMLACRSIEGFLSNGNFV